MKLDNPYIDKSQPIKAIHFIRDEEPKKEDYYVGIHTDYGRPMDRDKPIAVRSEDGLQYDPEKYQKALSDYKKRNSPPEPEWKRFEDEEPKEGQIILAKKGNYEPFRLVWYEEVKYHYQWFEFEWTDYKSNEIALTNFHTNRQIEEFGEWEREDNQTLINGKTRLTFHENSIFTSFRNMDLGIQITLPSHLFTIGYMINTLEILKSIEK